MDNFLGNFLLVAVSLAVYFAPFMIALWRGHRNTGAIMTLNLFLGWTLIGWVGALVWSVLAGQESRPA